MTTTTPTKTKTIQVEVYVPVMVELEVENTEDTTILNSLWDDFKNPDSKNTWELDYSSTKNLLRDLDEVECMNSDDYFFVS